MRKNKKLILISSILATTAIAVVPALSIVNNTNAVSVSDSQLDNVVQNSGQVQLDGTIPINSNECNVGSSKATEWMGITSGGLVNFEIEDEGLTATVKNVSATTIASTYLKIPGSITYNGNTYTVTSIDSNAFLNCFGLNGTLTIPASVTSIGGMAFNGCSGLTGTLDISASVTYIGSYAFYRCNFASISVDTNNKTFSKATNLGKDCHAVIDNTTGIFDNNSNAVGSLGYGNLIIPTRVTSIRSGAFVYCSGLTGTLTIPASVTSIDRGAFESCSGLTTLDLTSAQSLKTIGNETFKDCTGLIGTLAIPASVTSINDAFVGCTGLTTLDLTNAASMASIQRYAFNNCRGLTSVIFSTGKTSISELAFSGCSSITNITVLATTPPTIAVDSFAIFTATLHVPAGSEDAYKSDAIWGKFKIEPIPTPPIPDPVKPTDNLNLPLIIGATVGGAVVVLATIAGVVTYVAKRNKKLENK